MCTYLRGVKAAGTLDLHSSGRPVPLRAEKRPRKQHKRVAG
jgi:hypothetical protein